MNREEFEHEALASKCRAEAEERYCQAEAHYDFMREEMLLEDKQKTDLNGSKQE